MQTSSLRFLCRQIVAYQLWQARAAVLLTALALSAQAGPVSHASPARPCASSVSPRPDDDVPALFDGRFENGETTFDTLSGYAYDPSNPTVPIEVELLANGALVTRVFTSSYSAQNPDPLNVSGFRFRLPPRHLFTPSTVFSVRIRSNGQILTHTSGASSWTTPFTTGQSGSSLGAKGFVDSISADGILAGWGFQSPSAGVTSVTAQIEFYSNDLDGESWLDAITPSLSRPDVNAVFGVTGNHGFSFRVPSPLLFTATATEVHVYVVDRAQNRAKKLTMSAPSNPPVVLNNFSPAPTATGLSIDSSGVLSGTAYDPAVPATALAIRALADGREGIGTTIATTTTAAGGAFSVSLPPAYLNGTYHRIYVFAADPSSSNLLVELPGSPLEIGTQDYELSMGPPMGARDYLATFSAPFATSNSIPELKPFDDFMFYSAHALPQGAGTIFGDVVLSNLAPLGPVPKLLAEVRWVRIEAPSIKPWGDPNNLGVNEKNHTQGALNTLMLGGAPTGNLHVQFDSPYYSGRCSPPGTVDLNCAGTQTSVSVALPIGTIASVVAGQITALRQAHPGLRISEGEPLPRFPRSEIEFYIDTVRQNGASIDELDLDVDRGYAQMKWRGSWQRKLGEDLQRLANFCHARSIRFAPILWGGIGSTPASYADMQSGAASDRLDPVFFDNVAQWAQVVHDAIGTPDVVHVQSWHVTGLSGVPPGGWFGNSLAFVPSIFRVGTGPKRNLLSLADSCVAALTRPRAAVVTVNVPGSVQRGTAFTAQVQMRNTGCVPWDAAKRFGLGSENPRDNTTFGLGRVAIPSGVRVMPGQTITFTIQATAPATPGVYAFDWRMVQDRVMWFGDLASTALTVL